MEKSEQDGEREFWEEVEKAKSEGLLFVDQESRTFWFDSQRLRRSLGTVEDDPLYRRVARLSNGLLERGYTKE